MKGRKSAIHKEVHDAIGIPYCETPADVRGQCKSVFKDKFSAELIDKYSNLVGIVNQYNEKYYRGEEFYNKDSAEARFYEMYQTLKGSKSNFINDYINKIWYMLGQRAPTMNFGEKLIRSAYGCAFLR